MGVPLKVVETGFLKRQNHELSKPIRLIAKELEDIINRLLKLTESQDEKVAQKACESLLDYYAKMVEQKDRDEIQRRLAHIRYGGGKTLTTEEEDDTPAIDFDNIQDV